MASMKRTDNKGRILKDGENQMPDGRYRYQFTDNKGRRQSMYSWRLTETDRTPTGKREDVSLREKIKQVNRDIEDGIKTASSCKTTLNEVFALYMAGKYELKQSTRTNYMYMYKNYVSQEVGKKKISAIKYSDIKAFYNQLIREKGFKPNSMEIINTILHPVFTLAVRDGYIRSNPTDGVMVEIKRGHNWEKPKRHALTEQEQEAFVDFMAKSNIYNHWLPLFTVFLGTGCRVGEIIGLRWKDCDFENRIISINHNLVYRQQDSGNCEMHITTPKTAAGCRVVPMLEKVKMALLQEKKRQMSDGGSNAEIDGYNGFIFTNRNGYVHNPQTINRAIQRIYEAYNEAEKELAGKDGRKPSLIRHFSVHNLRHTFCTRFCENETNIKVIQEIMGHSDISTTMNIYAEATESKKKESFSNLEGKIKIS
ncbi:tyrosine-type recombinase/integrase [Lacrimispora sp.]|uniref:tyrosine-type recombinase/integrase n=1 Tax=Lacrimispora sp. TaxID=2719234 RepID=UPI0028A67EBB|nr:tyrosine-type recombinase/integrase [Lacrimispora sp.]